MSRTPKTWWAPGTTTQQHDPLGNAPSRGGIPLHPSNTSPSSNTSYSNRLPPGQYSPGTFPRVTPLFQPPTTSPWPYIPPKAMLLIPMTSARATTPRVINPVPTARQCQ